MLRLRILGINSGTSMDAIDLSLVEFTQDDPNSPLYMKPLKYAEMPMDPAVKRDTLRIILENRSSPQEMCELNFRLGHMFADGIARFLVDQDVDLDRDIDAIACHGQTIWFIPQPGPGETKSTLQMCEPTVLAQRFGKTVVTDFRAAEQMAGRQGAPLACFQDALSLIHPTLNRASQNIGGIANVAFVPSERDGGLDQSYDFDTGPGNVLIDAAVRFITNGEREYDKDGDMGARGTVYQPVVDEFLKNPYFSAPIPKTTGRELFGDATARRLVTEMRAKGLSDDDCVATITRITAASIVDAYKRYRPGLPLHEVYFCGGGSFNPNILKHIQECFPDTKIALLDASGITAASKEATSFAFMGLECLVGRPLIVTKIEAQEPTVMGKITPGRNYLGIVEQVAAFHKGRRTQDSGPWLPAVRDLRVWKNQTRPKESEDPRLE